ncbi:NUDIX domain-containing protein [Streptomyces yaizuensis]|uniref:NUDIX domain-containing protein n=1 Tax=Streptomyces yaizuensis TaxID=2989713 RepID=A0ABQ5P472_9ACTN|nr:NUDIX domain-containing protein [Streptomyces sp. YSPA8]GLF97253.1 NUDIX domain-containing protein [Streptomyces sp. YSPA8]
MAHADIDPATPPRRRIGAVVLVQNEHGHVLLVKPNYKPGWVLPGGGAHAGETIADAAARELAEETGLALKPTNYLVLDQVPANGETGSAEGLNVVLAGGTLTPEEAAVVAIPEAARAELEDLRWVPLDQLDTYTQPYQERRIRAALDARERGDCLPLLLLGEPVV